MQRSILDRLAVDTRSSKEYRSIYMSVEYRPMYRSILLSVDILGGSPSLHRYFTDTSLILHRCCTDASPTLYLHRMYWLISVDISVHTLVDTRPRLERSINALVLVDVSADTLVDTSVDSI